MITRISRVPGYAVRNIDRNNALHFGGDLIAIQGAIENLKRLAISVDVLPVIRVTDKKLFR